MPFSNRLFASIVSHGHESMIIDNVHLKELADKERVAVVLKDNLQSQLLREHARSSQFHYVVSSKPEGFGANNNRVFRYCTEVLRADLGDYFCLINPDVIVESSVLVAMAEEMQRCALRFATLDLQQDETGNAPDLNIKRFPSLLDFAKGFMFGANPAAYDKATMVEPCTVEWASGALLMFRVDLFRELDGFDERFFMYLEDVDICRRALEQCGEPLWYFPQFKALHFSQQANKKLFSKHFFWFLCSMLRYFVKYRFRTRPRPL